MFYKKELDALKRVNRFRAIKEYSKNIDLASNDYLGLASNKKQLKKAYKEVLKYSTFAPKASLLVNGYHQIHKKFENKIAKVNNFEKAVVVGSGFLANIALIESLVRKTDELFIDSEYHASGILASKLVDNVVVFSHNSVLDLEEKLKKSRAKRKIVAVEGIYSMSGDIVAKEIFDVVNRYNAILIVDEAHSSGVLGKKLLGVFEYYNLDIKPNYIKMGTLGKAYGSYGAYILASNEIIEFLINRAKPIIYSTAPSVFDIALAYVNLKYILKNSKKLSKKLEKRKELASLIFNLDIKSQILSIEVANNKRTLEIQKNLLDKNILVGAIRQPTVDKPIIRVILRAGVKRRVLKEALEFIKSCND